MSLFQGRVFIRSTFSYEGNAEFISSYQIKLKFTNIITVTRKNEKEQEAENTIAMPLGKYHALNQALPNTAHPKVAKDAATTHTTPICHSTSYIGVLSRTTLLISHK
jgi:thiazole synthase ThiGH ThiG subunit